MNFLTRVVRFLFWVLILSWGLRLLRYLVGSMIQNSQASVPPRASSVDSIPGTPAARRLVRDPVCGMHVDETRAIPLRDGGELLHFCSTACRDSYAASVRKLAANG